MRRFLAAIVVLGIIGLAAFWFLTIPETIADTALPANYQASAERGRTVFFAAGCPSCHTREGQEDKTLLGGGHGLKSPFGTFYAPNISPHPDRGIGKWTPAQFATAVLKGSTPSGSHYFPAFPYPSYERMKIEDALDLFAFIKTLPPDETRSKPHDVPFPFNVRRAMGGWKLLFLDHEPFSRDGDISKVEEAKKALWERGAYLVEGMGHCAECHSPRNMLGGIKAGQRFAGGPSPEGGGSVPNITQTQDGIGFWSEDEIVTALRTGETPEFDKLRGTMAEVVGNLAEIPEEDVRAMAIYLKSLPAKPNGQ